MSTAPLQPGLVSVTFRSLPAAEIVRLAAAAGLAGIEWGGDVHVPPGGLSLARSVGLLTRDAGLRVVSYGSYYKACACADQPDWGRILETALALGAPQIRIWAGVRGSADYSPAARAQVVDALRGVSRLAAAAGLSLALECHANTLTDTPESIARLLSEVGHPALRVHWQPPYGCSVASGMRVMQAIGPALAEVHVYHWRVDAAGQIQRLPLAAAHGDWVPYLQAAAGVPDHGRPRFALLEFVPGDDPAVLPAEARALRACLQAATPEGHDPKRA